MKYESLFARYYDYLAHDRREALATDEDISFLRHAFSTRCAIAVHEILDAGCGTGRYLIPLASAGFRLTGIDNSPEMISQCRARLKKRKLRADLVEADLMQLAESDAYDALLCMDSALCYSLEGRDIARVLTLFEHALRPGGLLVLEIFNAPMPAAPAGETRNREMRDGNLTIEVTERERYDPVLSLRHLTVEAAVADGGQKYVFSHEEVLKVMTAAEVTEHLENAGFEDISCELRRDTLAPESGDVNMVFLAVKGSGS